jgi:hypothetical protein
MFRAAVYVGVRSSDGDAGAGKHGIVSEGLVQGRRVREISSKNELTKEGRHSLLSVCLFLLFIFGGVV